MTEFFKQPKITGYRQLNEQEAKLMNQVKAKGQELQELVSVLNQYLIQQAADACGNATEQERLEQSQPMKWLAVGKTDLQTGLMALTRAVAQPGAF
jgi:hypothetical protein